MVVALGVTFVIMMGSIDLSTGGVITLVDIAIPFLFISVIGGPASFLLGLGIGAAFGLINGLVVTKAKVPSFLVTIATMFIAMGFAWQICGGWGFPFYDPLFDWVANGHIVSIISNVVFFSIILLILFVFVAFRTVFGRDVFAIGGAEYVASLSGISVDNVKIAVFVISGTLAALTGILLLGRVGVATIYIGDRYLLDGIAAVCLGGTALTGGTGGPHRTLLGALFMAVLSNGMNMIGLNPFTQAFIKGIFFIIAVSLTIDRTRIRVVK